MPINQKPKLKLQSDFVYERKLKTVTEKCWKQKETQLEQRVIDTVWPSPDLDVLKKRVNFSGKHSTSGSPIF